VWKFLGWNCGVLEKVLKSTGKSTAGTKSSIACLVSPELDMSLSKYSQFAGAYF
jgi:hypothetical protein